MKDLMQNVPSEITRSDSSADKIISIRNIRNAFQMILHQLLFFWILCSTFIGFSQDYSYKVAGVVENSDLGKKEGGVTVSVIKDGKVLGKVQ